MSIKNIRLLLSSFLPTFLKSFFWSISLYSLSISSFYSSSLTLSSIHTLEIFFFSILCSFLINKFSISTRLSSIYWLYDSFYGTGIFVLTCESALKSFFAFRSFPLFYKYFLFNLFLSYSIRFSRFHSVELHLNTYLNNFHSL